MTDKEKLDKIVAEIKRLYVYWDGVMQSSAATEAVARKNQCRELLSFYDTLQAEAKKEAVVKVEKIMAEVDAKFPKFCEEVKKMKFPRKAKVQGTLKSMLDNMDKDKLAKTREELANSSESCKDLEEAGKEWLRPQLDKSYEKYGENKMMELTHFDGYSMLEAIEFGAKWKEEQFEKNRLEHCNSITNEQAELEQGFIDQHLDKHDRMPTFLDAIEYGMRLQKEQMMEQAIDGEIGYWNLHGLSVNVKLPHSVEEGDKAKVIVIKED